MPAIVNEELDATLRSLLEDADGPVLVVDPSARAIEALVEETAAADSPPVVRLLADEAVLKDVMRDFIVASLAADLVEEEGLEMRTAQLDPGNALVLTADRTAALVTAGDEVAALTTDAQPFAGEAYDAYLEQWEEAVPFPLRTPPLSRVRQSLRDEIGPAVEADFNAVLGSLDTARGDENGLDEVAISLLVAARNEELLYDISKWGEDVGIASKATFSRTKTSLEDLGLIDTEKVPIDVGRPRLRLKFAHPKLRESSADQLASVATGLMH